MKHFELLIATALTLLPLQSFATSSVNCREIKGGSAVAQFDAEAGTLVVADLVRGERIDFKILRMQPTVSGGVLLIAQGAGGFATLNVEDGDTSTLQALGTSAYLTCHR